MSTVQNPAHAGKETDPSITTPETTDDLLDFLERFQTYLDENLPRVREACERLDARIRAKRDADAEEPRTERDVPLVPGLAFRSDGAILLHVDHLEGADLSARQTWTGVVLSEAEASDAVDRLADAADEAAGHIAGYVLFGSSKKPDNEPGGTLQ